METYGKIEIYEEISEIKKHFQTQILENILHIIDTRIKFDTDEPIPSKECFEAKKEGFIEAKRWIQEIIDKEKSKIRNS